MHFGSSATSSRNLPHQKTCLMSRAVRAACKHRSCLPRNWRCAHELPLFPCRTSSKHCGKTTPWSKCGACAARCICCQRASFSLYVAALKPYRLKQERRWLAQYGVDDRALAAMAAAILEALRAGPLTRRQLTQALQPRLKHSAPQIQDLVEHGWGGLGKYVCLQGDLCVGPNQGQEATFVRRDHWLAEWEDVPGEQAEAWLLRRYLGAYGPAIVQDFAAWAGLSVRDARQIWQRLQPEMATISVEGMSAAVLESDLITLKQPYSIRKCICCPALMCTCSDTAASHISSPTATTSASTARPVGSRRYY